ncbi:hypothetical protein LCGC14_2054330, partial [marine sediment metagenome]
TPDMSLVVPTLFVSATVKATEGGRMPSRPVTVGTDATELLSYNNSRTSASINNNGSVAMFVGNDEFNLLAEGTPIAAGNGIDIIRALGGEPHIQWFGIVAVTPVDARVLESFGAMPVLLVPPPQFAELSEAD